VAVVLGTRPEAIKLAPVVLELRRPPREFRVTLASTGQHRHLLPRHLGPFGLKPDVELGIMRPGQSLPQITARSVLGLAAALSRLRPDLVMVEGDTSAVFAGALAAFYEKIPVAHVEAGLRTENKFHPFPEEINRRLTTVLTDLHLAPTPRAKENLLREGIPPRSIYVTGNTEVDALVYATRQNLPLPESVAHLPADEKLILVTAHRRESWGQPLRQIALALRDLANRCPDAHIVIAAHPNPVVRKTLRQVLGKTRRLSIIEPPDYFPFVQLLKRAYLILTDSGGIQELAPSLGVPVLVLRETTERIEGIRAGNAELVGRSRARILAAARALLEDPRKRERMARVSNPYGDGRAAGRIRQALLHYFGRAKRRPRDFDGDD
jgi:UDP-N-acetylglucosamine 2-epimerase (non-hydrolysing)